MFSKYLGRNEKNGFIQFVALQASCENVLRDLGERKGVNKEYLRYLRTGRAWMEKAINLRLANLDRDAQLDFQKHIRRVDPVVFIPSSEAKREFRELERMGNTLHMSLDDFQDWYGEYIEKACKICTKAEYKACPVYNILMKYDIVAVSPDGKYCPFSYVDSEEARKALKQNEEHRIAKKNLDIIERAEKKINELIAERNELKEKLTKNEIDMCKLEGTVCKMKSDLAKKQEEIQKVKIALNRADVLCSEQKEELATKDIAIVKMRAENEKLKAKVNALKQAVKDFAEGVLKDADGQRAKTTA